ncbi:MAG: hypothetical protein SRB2_03876 [Desulfobacteraceae bacterium Eth-SRB2]|nr:MAG: hypothetical protein SRB2_03876 [Desulfobacteraceae bacterium Eth-SRB2]
MAWQKFRRIDTYVTKDAPLISISRDKFNFNSVFSRLARISPDQKVIIHLDPPAFRIGFEFVQTDDRDALTIVPMNKKNTGGGFMCTARGVFSQYEWVAKVGRLQSSKDRKFTPDKSGSIWAIQLCPAFELHSSRKDLDIPAESYGIYRYLDADGTVVYIGRGRIRQRLSAPERQDWIFETIQYSIVEAQEDRERWETYWIQRYKEENKGRLPYYNKLSGTTSGSDAQHEASADA